MGIYTYKRPEDDKNAVAAGSRAAVGYLNEAPLQPATTAAQKATAAPQATPASVDRSKYQYNANDNDTYMQALSALQAAQKEVPSYAGTYDSQLQDLYDKIVNRDKFKYNLNEDMLYQQYADQYAMKGQMAMRDTMGQAAALTGGYGNTYAQSVGQQQYNAYLQQLNDVVPELYGMALDQYNAEGDRMMQQYNMLDSMADKEYSRYQDNLNQYWQNLNYLQGQADTAYDRGYNAWYDAYKMGTEQDQIAYQKYLDQRNYDYQLGRDAVEDKRYDDQFAYQKEQDAITNNQWQQQFDYGKEQDAIANSQWQQQFQYQQGQDAWNQNFQQEQFDYQKELDAYQQQIDADRFAYQKEQDAFDREFAQQQFDYGKQQDAVANSQWQQTFDYSKEQDAVANSQWQQQFDYGKAQDAYNREQQAGMTAYEKQLNNYGTLADLITKTGYTPTDAELAAAGMTRAQANAYRSTFVPKSTGSSTGSSYVSKDSSNPVAKTETEKEPSTKPDLSDYTYPTVKTILDREGEDTRDLVDAYTWNAQKRAAMQNGSQYGSPITQFNSYEEYLAYYVKKKGYGD